MASDTLAFMYQLQGANYNSLTATKFKVAVVDDDSAGLNSSQLSTLSAAGKSVMSYLSIGEAEDYRSYWTSSWDSNPPSFLLGENPDWPGNFNVKFWDPTWQNIIITRAVELAKEGYSGVMLDVVDGYSVQSVQNAYKGTTSAREEMMKFVGALSDAVKAVNPNFQVMQNNALDLLTVNPDNPSSATNTAYLNKIDGINAETTFFLQNNAVPTWSAWNLQYLAHAVDANKVVFSIDYPTNEATQQAFITQAIAKGFIPFVGNQSLSQIDSTNYQVLDKLPANSFDWLNGDTTPPPPDPTPDPTPDPDPAPVQEIIGTNAANTLNGGSGVDEIFGKKGNDVVHGNDGSDYIQGDEGLDTVFGDAGNDAIFGNNGADSLYGGAGTDYMEGNIGADRLYGDAGTDYMFGNDGSDTLSGGAGNDDLYGGAGNDRFAFEMGTGQDIINDFQNAGAATGDIIQVDDLIYNTKSQILSHITYADGDAVLHLEGTNTVTIVGVAVNALTAADFQII